MCIYIECHYILKSKTPFIREKNTFQINLSDSYSTRPHQRKISFKLLLSNGGRKIGCQNGKQALEKSMAPVLVKILPFPAS